MSSEIVARFAERTNDADAGGGCPDRVLYSTSSAISSPPTAVSARELLVRTVVSITSSNSQCNTKRSSLMCGGVSGAVAREQSVAGSARERIITSGGDSFNH